MLGEHMCYVQLGDTVVLDRRLGDVRMVEGDERPLLAVPLAAQRFLGEAGLDGIAEEGLYVALWRGSAEAWLPSQGFIRTR